MPTLSKGDMEAILKARVGIEDFELVACEDRSISDVSMGYLSSSGKVTLVYRSDGIIQELDVFVKRLPDQEGHRNDVIYMGSFRKEPMVYNMFLNRIIGPDSGFFPRCYLARPDDIVVLEDMTSSGFINLPCFHEKDMEHCKKAIDSIAKLHAASFIFEKNNDCRLDEYIPDLDKEHIYSTEENHVGRMRYLSGISALQKFTEVYLPNIRKSVAREAFEFMELVPHKLGKSEKFPNAISHSDLWNNNIMFKYDDLGKVTDVCLLDYQCASYRPPAFDLQLFLHCCTGRSFRSQHYTQLLEYYFKQLEELLQEEDINLNSIMTWDTFNDMCEETLPFAVVFTAQFMHFVGIPEGTIKPIMADEELWKEYYTVDRNCHVLQAAEESAPFRKKVTESLKDLFACFVN